MEKPLLHLNQLLGGSPMERLEPRRLLASPELDLAFGEGGIGKIDVDGYQMFVVKQLEDGKVVAAGAGPGFDIPLVARFNADGTLDTSFDGDGRLILNPNASSYGTVADASLAADGKILMLSNTGTTMRIHRFNPDGTPDSSFGTNGLATVTTVGGIARTVGAQPDGKVVFGYVGNNTSYLSRLNNDGSIDASFRGGITTPTPLPQNFFFMDTILSAPDGKIYFSGESQFDIDTNPAPQSVLARFNVDGSIDTTYGGGDGMVNIMQGTGSFSSSFLPLTLDSANRILVTAQGNYEGRQTTLVKRFKPSGATDTSFGGGDGWVDLGPDLSGPVASPVVVTPDGKISGAIGYFRERNRVRLFRLNASGTLDSGFGNRGIYEPEEELPEPRGGFAINDDGDFLIGGRRNDIVNGGLAVARLAFDPPDVFLNSDGRLGVTGTAGNDTITLSRSGDQLIVLRNGVTTSIDAADVSLFAVSPSSGNDVVIVNADIDCNISGGSGDDSITVRNGNITIEAGDGNDTVFAGDGNHTAYLGIGDDRITTGAGNDNIFADNDVSAAGNDTIITGDGDDFIQADVRGSNGNDSVIAGGGNDTILMGDGDDFARGSGGNDIIQAYVPYDGEGEIPDQGTGGGIGNKIFFGDDGDDTFVAGTGADLISGGAGNDEIVAGTAADTVNGGDGNDIIFGDDQGYTYYNTGGDDVIAGDAGDDWIDAESGNNTINGGTGDDKLFGSTGTDEISGGDGADRIYGNDAVDSLYGNGGNDTIYGGANSDHMRGNGGRDKMYGNGGNDRMYGGESGDYLYGQPGLDQLFGEGGNDRLYGDDGGADVLRGGAGNDVFITLDGAVDQLFGDGGTDSANADASDVLASIEVNL